MASAQPLQHPNWCFTFNYGSHGQPTREDVGEFWTDLCTKAFYAVAGHEIAPSTGQKHLQGYVQLRGKLRITQLKKLKNALTVYWAAANGDEADNEIYVTKEGRDIIRFGDEPRVINPGKRVKRDYGRIVTLAMAGKLDEISDESPAMFLQYFNTLTRIKDAYAKKCKDLEPGSKMMYIYGPTGTGKSRSARKLFADLGEPFYNKLQNKWWDHYKGERCVLIDDLGLETGRALVNYLKLWLDMYVFKSEYKGGASDLRPKLIVITSNYHPYEIWGGTKDYDPIMRRLDVTHVGPSSSAYLVPETHGEDTIDTLFTTSEISIDKYGLVFASAKRLKQLKCVEIEELTEDEEEETEIVRAREEEEEDDDEVECLD